MKPKRIISLLVAVCMLVAMLPVSALPAFAATTIVENGIKYNLGANNTVAVAGIDTLTSGDIEIPEKVTHEGTEYTVTSVANDAFKGKDTLQSIKLPDTVTEIGMNAFEKCTASIEVDFSKLKKVESNAFWGCTGLEGNNIDLSSLSVLGSDAFLGCSKLSGSLTIPTSITSLPSSAFQNCSSLSSLTISGSNITIGYGVFLNCRSLSKVEFKGTVSSIGNNAFNGTGLTGDFTLPSELIALGSGAFDNSGIDRIILPKTLQNATIAAQNKAIYYDGTREEFKNFLTDKNITITNINQNTMTVGSQYLRYDCDVTFDTDGGTPTSEPQNKIYRMSLLDSSKVNTPSKEGYVFDGWYYTDSTSKEETKFDPAKDKVTDSMTLKAKWTVPAAVTVSGLPTGELAQGKQYPFTVAIDPKDDDGGKGGLKIEVGSEDSLYCKLNNGKWQLATTGSWSVDLEKGEYSFMLVPGQTGPDSLNVTLTKNGITDPRDTVAIDFTVREYQNAEVSLEGLDNVTFKQGEPQEFSVRVTPNDDSGKACLDFGKDNADIEYQENGEWKQMPEDGLTIDLDEGEQVYALRYTPQLGGKNQSLRVTVKPVDSDFGKNETTIDIAAKAKKSLTLTGGTVKVNGEEVALDADKECVIEEGSTVEVTFDKSILSDAQVFDQWSIKPDSVLNAVDPKAETITFKMPAEKVTIEAMTRDASIQEEPNILGTAAVIGIGVAGTAVLGYQGYMIGTELYLNNVLPAGAAIPQNYGELAVLVWTDAGKPAPAAVLAADATDEQKALTWAVENQLISADKAADASVTRWEVIKTWNQEQEMKG